jgi:paraquat-inducible protein B
MSEPPPPDAGEPEIPEAVLARRSRLIPELIWAVPIVAVLIGGWLAVKAIMARGPTITISFRDGGGLAPGKTKIKYREVEVGEVRTIGFSPDRSTVVLTAVLTREAAPWLVADTRFWVVRARVAAGEVSGLETLLSGSYIGLDVGTSKQERRAFEGLEAAPIIIGGTPGRSFIARAQRSVEVGSPVFFHHLQVGQVTASELEADGSQVSVGVFVRAPYDRYVTTATRFWDVTGIDVSLDTSGLKIETESLASIVLGGITFGTAPGGQPAPPAPAGQRFVLFASREQAMKAPDTEAEDYTLVFRQSVRGLVVGAPVDFRGMPIGEVIGVGVDYDPVRLVFTTPVDVRIYPGRLRARLLRQIPEETPEVRMRRFIDHGLRAQIRSESLLAGKLFVALDFFPHIARPPALDAARSAREIPTVPGDLEGLQATLARFAKKLDRLPFDRVGPIVDQVRQVLASAGRSFDDADTAVKQLTPTAQGQADLEEVIRQIIRAARSVRGLADSLEQHPESLIRGRKRGSR